MPRYGAVSGPVKPLAGCVSGAATRRKRGPGFPVALDNTGTRRVQVDTPT